MVVPGTYRLTIYASGIFGEYIQDNITIKSAETPITAATWREETSGTRELWRLGTPDHSSGEFRHGFAKDETHTQKPQEYRVVWLAYDFLKDFREGVRYRIGRSRPERDWNYVHWSEFGGKGGENVSDWHIFWDHDHDQGSGLAQGLGKNGNGNGKATLTVQLAGVKTESGNSHVLEDGRGGRSLPFSVLVNGKVVEVWKIP